MLSRRARGLVVEVDLTTQAAQSHTTLSPQSPVSILQNSPFYSPVLRSPSSITSPTAFMEQIIGNVCSDDQADFDSINEDYVHDINDSDEGIESEDGEDIDAVAFKQLIR